MGLTAAGTAQDLHLIPYYGLPTACAVEPHLAITLQNYKKSTKYKVQGTKKIQPKIEDMSIIWVIVLALFCTDGLCFLQCKDILSIFFHRSTPHKDDSKQVCLS